MNPSFVAVWSERPVQAVDYRLTMAVARAQARTHQIKTPAP
ncbi:hypothetical protein [uncultured Algimonas sp.]|nr:hypothetical protein [uncultured Algimonas sp.]